MEPGNPSTVTVSGPGFVVRGRKTLQPAGWPAAAFEYTDV